MEKPRVTIIGLGRVGTALLNALTQEGYSIISVYNRSETDPDVIKSFPETLFKKGMPNASDPIGDWIFLTVSDDAIASVARSVSETAGSFTNKNVIHCSGTHSSESLQPFKNKGARVASFHPMKAITQNADSFRNIWFDIEGDQELLDELEKLASELNAKTFRVEPEAKPLLHAAAVVASNYLVVLADLVAKISEKGNIPREKALKAVTPLIQQTLDNINELGVRDALTGPIARGDVDTIKQHINSLNNSPDLLSLYKILGLEAVNIASQSNTDSASLKEIKQLLS